MKSINNVNSSNIQFGINYNSNSYGTFKVLYKMPPEYNDKHTTAFYMIRFNLTGYKKQFHYNL